MKQHIPFSRSITILLLLALLLPSTNLRAQLADDSTDELREYYNTCARHLDSPEVLKMADTLYQRALQANNDYYRILSRSTVLTYYYFKSDKDKIVELVNEVKQMSRQHNELGSYYFAWGSRLITYYLNNGMANHALLEARNMLQEAQQDNFLPGIAECYKAMANISQTQEDPVQASINFRKLIEITEQIKPRDINLPVYYEALFENLLEINQMEEAEAVLKKADRFLEKTERVTPYQKLCLEQSYLWLHLKKKDLVAAQKNMEVIEQLFAQNKEIAIFSDYLEINRLRYRTESKQYTQALAVIDTIWKKDLKFETKFFAMEHKARIYWEMNEWKEAAQCYREYMAASDSTRKQSMLNSANEIAGLLNLGQLKQEKQQLMLDMQDRKLHTTYWALLALGLVLIGAAIAMLRFYRLNRKLIASERMVLQQNNDLRHTGQQLLKAKEQAEEASQMKTHFIQNITHEVRTPLNAIVGFSQVLVEFYEKPETEEYSSLIRVNSDYLLRMFNDILELSNIDQVDGLPYDIVDDIHSSCLIAVGEIRPFLKEGVQLLFTPSVKEQKILTNPTYVLQALTCLLHNSTKFTREGSITLECTISESDRTICYVVTDTGCGIPLEQQEVVFERFKKLDYFMQGSGLGLSVSRVIAMKLGGALYIDKEYTTGSRFVLTLPYLPQ